MTEDAADETPGPPVAPTPPATPDRTGSEPPRRDDDPLNQNRLGVDRLSKDLL